MASGPEWRQEAGLREGGSAFLQVIALKSTVRENPGEEETRYRGDMRGEGETCAEGNQEPPPPTLPSNPV